MNYYSKETPDPDIAEVFASPEDEELIADVFLPDKNRRNGAAVVFVHGGGWKGGKRQAFLWHAHRLSLHGYVTCTIDYRLSQTAPFPAALVDCQSAVKWVRDNAERFEICSEKVGAVGSSAGGHLAACLGVFDEQVNCVVDIHGVHDFVTVQERYGVVKKGWEEFIGGSISEKRELWVQASPALHVDCNSAPMFLVHDPQDETVPYEQSLILGNVLMKEGRPMRFLPSPGSGHGFFYNPENNWTEQIWPLAVEWLDYHLLGTVSTNLTGLTA